MARHKDVQWDIPDPPASWESVNSALLMDIRDELQKLNRLLHCSNFIGIPRVLGRIDKRLGKRIKPK